jgi:hypothetical protein
MNNYEHQKYQLEDRKLALIMIPFDKVTLIIKRSIESQEYEKVITSLRNIYKLFFLFFFMKKFSIEITPYFGIRSAMI